MSVIERRLSVDQLRPGMYVCRLDRSWEGTPFPLQGFQVATPEDVELLANWCREVTIDTERSSETSLRPSILDALGYAQQRVNGKPLPAPVRHALAHDCNTELPLAAAAMAEVREQASAMLNRLAAHTAVSADELQAAVAPVVSSVIRNPDAWFWLSALRRHGDYAYEHALNVCALATVFGRHLGMPRALLDRLAMAGLLLDVGMTEVPGELLRRNGPLDPEEWGTMRAHVEHAMEMLSSQSQLGADVLEMIACHHERHDGSGYPRGLSGTQIPLLGRMLGVADSYHSLCSERPFRPALSPHDALQRLYRERDKLFQAELVEQFSQCLGVYPTGSLVELSTGEIAVVIAQNPARRLFPRVTLLTDAAKRLDAAFRQVDLWSARADDGNERVCVQRSLPFGAHGIDPTNLFLA